MNRVSRYFSDVPEPRQYSTGLPQEGVYSQQIYGASRGGAQVVEAPRGPAPWWAQGVVEGPQPPTQITRYDEGVRLVQNNQLNPQDRALYERYLTVDRPYDLVVEGDRERRSNGKPKKMDYSGRWRQVGDPYYYAEQQQQQQQQQVGYVESRPVPRSYVTEEMPYSPYGYQSVVPPVNRQAITERITSPIERRIVSGRVY